MEKPGGAGPTEAEATLMSMSRPQRASICVKMASASAALRMPGYNLAYAGHTCSLPAPCTLIHPLRTC